ncbi:MAG: M24 family metallopeptidase [Candidatus Bathyarchaeia archaeon]
MDLIESRISKIAEKSGCDAIMTFGVGNFRYFTGALLPFAENYKDRYAVAVLPKGEKGFAVTPTDWSEAVKDQGYFGDIVAYDENKAAPPKAFSSALARELEARGLSKSKIGFDALEVSVGLLKAIRDAIPSAHLVAVDEDLAEARIIKAPEEVKLIEKACIITDRGIIHALNHLEGTLEGPGYTIPEFTERVRVHIFESGGSGVGLLSTNFASDAQLTYTLPRGSFRNDEIFRVDVSSHVNGYWTSLKRMCYTGKPPKEYLSAYADNVALKSFAEDLMRPGVGCNEIFTKVLEEAGRKGIPLYNSSEMGHGVGVNHYEAPYIRRMYARRLEPGMVLTLDIKTLGPKKEIFTSKDVYEITDRGCRKLSWYRDWGELYEVVGFRATH